MNRKVLFWSLIITGLLSLGGCRSTSVVPYSVGEIDGKMIPVNSSLDAEPDEKAVAILTPYKKTIDSLMYEVIGYSEETMAAKHPESLLSNLVADVLRYSTLPYIDKVADMSIVNLGGLRNVLSKGNITRSSIYEILPFENSLCILTLKGDALVDVCKAIAKADGQGVSGVRMVITKEGGLVSAQINGKPIDADRQYTIATIDYLADGNSGLTALTKCSHRFCPENTTLRSIFLNYVIEQTKSGKHIVSQLDGRISYE